MWDAFSCSTFYPSSSNTYQHTIYKPQTKNTIMSFLFISRYMFFSIYYLCKIHSVMHKNKARRKFTPQDKWVWGFPAFQLIIHIHTQRYPHHIFKKRFFFGFMIHEIVRRDVCCMIMMLWGNFLIDIFF